MSLKKNRVVGSLFLLIPMEGVLVVRRVVLPIAQRTRADRPSKTKMQAQILIYITTFLFYTSALLIHDGLIAGVINERESNTAMDIRRFKMRNAEMIEDHQTGLVWQRCPWGSQGSECEIGDAMRVPWQDARLIASTHSTEGVKHGVYPVWLNSIPWLSRRHKAFKSINITFRTPKLAGIGPRLL